MTVEAEKRLTRMILDMPLRFPLRIVYADMLFT